MIAGFCGQANTCYEVYYSSCSWNEYILPPMVITYNPSSSADVNCNAVVKERSRLNCGWTRLFHHSHLLHTTVWTQKGDPFRVQWTLRIYFPWSILTLSWVLPVWDVHEVTSYTARSLKISSRSENFSSGTGKVEDELTGLCFNIFSVFIASDKVTHPSPWLKLDLWKLALGNSFWCWH